MRSGVKFWHNETCLFELLIFQYLFSILTVFSGFNLYVERKNAKTQWRRAHEGK
jgi:hypothetical protein